MLNDIAFFTCSEKVDASIVDAKEIFGENTPYFIEQRLGGREVIFNDHFIRTAREALSTGCMAKMNDVEVILFNRWVTYENGNAYRDITQTDDYVLKALDEWFMRELKCEAQPTLNACYDSPTHTWKCAGWKDL